MLQLVAHAAVGIFAAHIVVDEDDSGRRGANRRLSFLGACVGRSWLANALDAGRTLFGDIPRLGFCQGHGIQFTGTSDTTAKTLLRIADLPEMQPPFEIHLDAGDGSVEAIYRDLENGLVATGASLQCRWLSCHS